MSNKVVELKENDLLKTDRLCEYTSIVLVKNHQLLRIPIVRNSWKYRGQQESILSFDIDRECVIMREDLGSFYVKKRQKRRRKKQPNE